MSDFWVQRPTKNQVIETADSLIRKTGGPEDHNSDPRRARWPLCHGCSNYKCNKIGAVFGEQASDLNGYDIVEFVTAS